MKKLLEYILKNIVKEDSFEIKETNDNGQTHFDILAKPDSIGLIIGKNGRTIKAIQNILRVKARLDKTSVFINVQEAV